MKQYVIDNDTAICEILENNEIKFDFPVLYPNPNYFNDVKEVLNSYGFVFENLSEVNFDIEKYIEDCLNNPGLSCFVKEEDFKVSKVINDKYIGVVDERLLNKDNECLFESFISNECYYIKSEDMEFIATLFLNLGNLKLYFNGSNLLVDNQINKTKKFIYLD